VKTIDEITASAAAMRRHCVRGYFTRDGRIEIVGTGGRSFQFFNISTTSQSWFQDGVPSPSTGTEPHQANAGRRPCHERSREHQRFARNKQTSPWGRKSALFPVAQNIIFR
jgi:anthranilate phosphoribosyltransferase